MYDIAIYHLKKTGSISFHYNNTIVEGFSEEKARKWIDNVISREGFFTGNLAYIFCNDDYLLQLNQDYLQHDTLTDIITFDYQEEMEGVSGDIFISTERVEENASELGVVFIEELLRVMAHGVLHLLGYGDKTPAEKKLMRETENYYLSLFS